MMPNSVLDYLGVSGLVALVTGALAWGGLHQRVKALEDEDVADKCDANGLAIAQLSTAFEERTRAIQSDVKDIKRLLQK